MRPPTSAAKPGRDPNQPIDSAYTAKIKEYTTEPFFLSPLMDYLPASKGVPTPRVVLGDIAGAPTKLPYATRQTPEPGVAGYGFGVQISQEGFLGHEGSVAGYTAQFDFDPATTLGVIVLSNGRNGNGSGPQLLQALVQEARRAR